MNTEDFANATQEQPLIIETTYDIASIGFVKDEQSAKSFVMVTPKALGEMVAKDIHVFMQHGFAEGSQYSDLDYANEGVEFVDDFFQLANMSKALVKFQPFTFEEISIMKNGLIIFSSQDPNLVDMDYVQLILGKKIAALAFNLIEDEKGKSMSERILTETLSETGINIALSNFLLPYLTELSEGARMRFVLQKNPSLMDSVYCFNGDVCNMDIADNLNLPYRDIVTLCWDLN